MKEKFAKSRNCIFIKLKSKAGFSLLELLVAVIVLLLVSGGLATASTVANNQFVKSMRNSEAQELYTNLKSLLDYELRHVDTSNSNALVYDETTGVVSKFHSKTYSSSSINEAGTLVSIDDDNNETEYGEIAFSNNSAQYNRLLGKAAYPHDIQAKVTIYYDEDNNIFTVDTVIAVNDEPILENKPYQVIPLN